MRRSGSSVPKPLVRVRGVPVLERNVTALLRAGFTDLHVAVSGREDGVGAFAGSRCRALVEALGGTLSVLTEQRPLGSIGAAAFLADYADVLVVNADNLTSLDLCAMLTFHQQSGAALTLAVHDQPFPMPFGEIVMDGDVVTAYQEKPTLVVRVCSAVSVLAPDALGSMTPGEAVGLPALANRLLDRAAPVRSFFHQAPWIDVNDLAAAERAEALLGTYPDQFELWPTPPHRQTAALLLCSRRGVVLERAPDGAWCLPRVDVTECGDGDTARAGDALGRLFGVDPQLLTTFDEVDTVARRVVRTYVFVAEVFAAELADADLAGDVTWVAPEHVDGLDQVSDVVSRALAVRAASPPCR